LYRPSGVELPANHVFVWLSCQDSLKIEGINFDLVDLVTAEYPALSWVLVKVFYFNKLTFFTSINSLATVYSNPSMFSRTGSMSSEMQSVTSCLISCLFANVIYLKSFNFTVYYNLYPLLGHIQGKKKLLMVKIILLYNFAFLIL
jgi:hypothetical protein